jgi:hypothetical protein
MQIKISTTQELQFVMCMDSHARNKSGTSAVSLFFVDGNGLETPTATFDEAIRSLSEAGVHLVAEVTRVNLLKTKRKACRAEKKRP